MIPALSDALRARGYEDLTAVQVAVSDPDLITRDLLVSAQTGSGKTVAFGLAIAPTLLGDDARFGQAGLPLGLVIAPTRELALQVKAELSWLYASTGAQIATCVGGMDIRTERRALERGAHIVVGTPGRLRDHIEREALVLDGLRAVVLDEADEMLDLGFRDDLEFMLGEAPEDRRTLLFSATVPPMIATLAEHYQRDAERINTVGRGEQHADIAYQAVRVHAADAENAIFNLLRFHHDASAIVFANTRAAVNHMTARLTNRGLNTVSLSGELSQTERTHALQAMRDGRARVCVATDVAARGIDLPNLTLVIHADLPSNTESLLHRSGRTGRAGRKGISALIVTPRAMGKATRILKWAKITADWVEAPTADAILQADEARLLDDPDWALPLEEDEAAFAEKLLAKHDPALIAGAFLRLARKGHAAPEDLRAPDAPAPRPDKKPAREFGPSRWVSLSVGAQDRAEARWLLPLLCNSGGLDKQAIGAIRVQDSETFVELAEASVESFQAALGDGGALEDGVTATLLDSAPDLPPRGPARPKPGGKSFGKGRDEGGRPGKPWEKDSPRAPRPPRHDAPRPAQDAGAEGSGSRWSKARSDDDAPPPRRDDVPRGKGKPYKAKDGPRGDAKPYGSKPYGGKPDGKPGGKFAGKPAGKYAGKPGGKPGGKPAWSSEGSDAEGRPSGPKHGAKPAGKFGGKPGGGKPGGKPGGGGDARFQKRSAWDSSEGKPARGEGRPAGKPYGKPDGGKPRGKPPGKGPGKPAGKPAPRASDTSKRFTPPKAAKGGTAPPRRKG